LFYQSVQLHEIEHILLVLSYNFQERQSIDLLKVEK